MEMEIVLKPIGFIRTGLSDEEVKGSWPYGVEAEIEVLEEFKDALEGIDGFSHLIVIFYMHKVTEEQRRVLKARHKRFIQRYGFKLEELPLVGVFCLDSPHRPNPIGLTIVELIERRGRVLKVKGMDAFDGTPVLDIKPYTPSRCKVDLRFPAWYTRLMEELKRRGVETDEF